MYDKLNRIIIILLLLAIGLPLIIENKYWLHILIMGYIWSIAVYGLNIIIGYTGQLSLGHASFMAIGAYTIGILNIKTGMAFWPALVISLLVTSLIGYLAGLISLRTKGHYFTIFTLCIGVIIQVVISRWEKLTGGENGLCGIKPPSPISFPGLGQIDFSQSIVQYYFILSCLILTIFLVRRIVNSLLGRTFLAIKSSEELTEVIGINVMRNKILAFVLSTFFAGLSGALFAEYIRFLGPQLAEISVNFDMLIYLFVGGSASIAGPLLGAVIVSILSEWLQYLQNFRQVIFGPILIILIMFFPSGLAGALNLLWKRLLKNGGAD